MFEIVTYALIVLMLGGGSFFPLWLRDVATSVFGGASCGSSDDWRAGLCKGGRSGLIGATLPPRPVGEEHRNDDRDDEGGGP